MNTAAGRRWLPTSPAWCARLPAVAGDRTRSPTRLAVLVPVGPREDLVELADTLDSVRCFTPADTLLLLLNDGARPAVHRVGSRSGLRTDVLDLPGPGRGITGGLTWTVAHGLRRVLDHPDVDVVLRLDADALLTGPGIDVAARAAFAADRPVGALGSFDRLSTGERRDFGPAAWVLHQDLRSARAHHPIWAVNLRRVLRQARHNGYVDGEHALGTQLFSVECLRRLARARLLPAAGVRSSRLGDDQFIGLAVRAVGLRTADFASGSKPLGLRWQGLPATPAELLSQRKLVVHSVKSHGEMDGAAVRAQFRARRTAG
jgi:hypothetical protein